MELRNESLHQFPSRLCSFILQFDSVSLFDVDSLRCLLRAVWLKNVAGFNLSLRNTSVHSCQYWVALYAPQGLG